MEIGFMYIRILDLRKSNESDINCPKKRKIS